MSEPLEEYLLKAPIESVLAWPLKGAHPSYLLILRGAVGVIAKPVDESPGGPELPRREVAAWVLARDIGWQDLIATTVLRDIPSARNAGQQTEASLQVIWPVNERGADLTQVPDDDVWRAGILDAIIVHGDRHNANYLSVPPASSAVRPRLKLVDHGYAFTAGDTASPFYLAKRGQRIPASMMEALSKWRSAAAFPGNLSSLLGRNELEAMTVRADRILDSGTLSLN